MAKAVVATLSVCLLAGAVSAQKDERLEPVLKASSLKTLNRVAKKWIEAELKWDQNPRARKARDKARSKFMNELEKQSKKSDALASVGNMLAIFDAVFPYKRASTSGEVKKVKGANYHLLAPKPYKNAEAYRSVLVLPGWDEAAKKWADPRAYLTDNWKKSVLGATQFSLLPELRQGDDYDKPADLVTDAGRLAELDRIKGVLSAFGDVQRSFHLDRKRMFLDCGAGTAGFGMRLVTYFPSRFAGVILRKPVKLEKMQLGSLAGMAVLMVTDGDSKPVAEALRKRLAELSPPAEVLMVDAKDSMAAIDKWMAAKRRRLYPLEVTIAPNHDRFHKAFWVEIISCEPLDAVKPGDEPFVKVKADPEENKIVVTSRHVSEIGFYLNDYIVDLDKEVTIVINGKEIKGNKFQRSIRNVERYMRRAYDPTALYTAYHRMGVPKPEKKDGDGEK